MTKKPGEESFFLYLSHSVLLLMKKIACSRLESKGEERVKRHRGTEKDDEKRSRRSEKKKEKKSLTSTTDQESESKEDVLDEGDDDEDDLEEEHETQVHPEAEPELKRAPEFR
ncbi:hypothetical protein F2Q68_00033997 [Brassica cretica]|uniref:Uncharacterized protein n=1 Tax=Brassica cretica TaxID=69181 RepID=A0A8S9H2Z4_BRACR|nr:hypothetical protein F2Q68_00033997 [Brassica cretica]